MGGGGLEYGLAVFVGEEGLAAYRTLTTGSVDPEPADSLYKLNPVSAMLADREDLETPDRTTIRELGLKYRGRGSWPLFRRTGPGHVPWFLEADEAVFSTMALQYVIDLVKKMLIGEFAVDLVGDIDSAPSAAERQDTIVRALERVDELPAKIIVDSVSAANLVETIMRHLGIELSAGPTPVLEGTKEEVLWFT